MIQQFIWVSLGGALGASLRFAFSLLVTNNHTGFFPWATLGVNILGCMLIGALYPLLHTQFKEQQHLSLFVITGILGGFTTFSSFALETQQLLSQKAFLTAITYVLSSNIVGIGVAIGSYWTVSKIIS